MIQLLINYNIMKKISIFLLIMVMAVIVSGCGKKPVSQPEPTVQTPAVENSAVSNQAPVEPAPAATEPAASAPAAKTKINANANISISNFSFEPASLTIKKGTTVNWINDDQTPHGISGNTFSSEPLNTGQSFSFTFNNTGTFNYICSIHPSMVGKIIVE